MIILFASLTVLYVSWIFILLTKKEKNISKFFFPDLSVILPAHNEEDAIKETVKSILDSEYPSNIEIVVINDGSSDNTAKIVKNLQKENNIIKLYTTNHIGKSRALNFGVTKASFNYFLFLDADSSIEKDTLKEIVKPLSEGDIGASSGIVRAKIKLNPLTWFQDFEYILSSGWRYLCFLIGSVSVLPGFLVIKKDVFKKIGGFSQDTLTEDFDITLSLKKAGYNAAVTTKAVMYTSTPASIKTLFKQRIRWGRGNFQVIKKHSDMLFSKKFGPIGYFTIPTQLYWYLFSILYLPSVLYWFFSDYYRYFFVQGVFISKDVILYLFKWISSYGMLDLIFKVFTGVYSINPLILATIINYIVTIFYNILIFFNVGKIKFVNFIAYLFIFPYYLFIIFIQFTATIYEIYNSIVRKKTTNVWSK
ncbi:MAG: glycosyltransferase family 2 protein [Candidatus Aenigmarchaeota archaeon]|nr:glycosyltransferase family 2 protein [Candidatus Aenigmarchaeota archaeon]